MFSQHDFAMRSHLGDERPSTFAEMIVIVEGIVTVVEQRYDLYSWYMLLVDGGSRVCNQIYLFPSAATWTPCWWLINIIITTDNVAYMITSDFKHNGINHHISLPLINLEKQASGICLHWRSFV